MKPLAYSLVASALLLALQARANSLPTPEPRLYSQSDFGGVGLLQMPSARMNPDGEFSLNGFFNDDYRRYSLSLQLLPWLETTIRYSDIRSRLYSNDPSFSGGQTLKDKGVDAKARLWQESRWLPQVAFGIRDFAGTGLFDAEYFVASKQAGPLDFTLGLGWGYLGTRDTVPNPFCEVADKYCVRTGETQGRGGSFDYQRMFKGPASLFGGVEYHTPWQPLRLKLEFDGNDYANDVAGNLAPKTPLNLGAVYRAQDWLDLHLGYERGDTLSLGLTMRTNFNAMKPSWNDQPRPEYAPTASGEEVNWQMLESELAGNAGYGNATFARSGNTLVVEAEQSKYRDRAEAEQRAGTLLVNHLPEGEFEQVALVEQRLNQPLTERRFDLAHYRRVADNDYPGAQPKDAIDYGEPGDYHYAKPLAGEDDWYKFSLSPVLVQSLGGPESFYLYQVGVNAGVRVDLTDNWLASSSVYVNLFDNLDKLNFTQLNDGSTLPPVRTLVREYVTRNPVRLDNLQLTRMDRLAPAWYGQAYAGYLETMFAGVGGELLYRPLNSNWALGADVNWVRQRDFDNQFGLMDYSVTTGHAGAYLKLPQFSNTTLSLLAGQYLAGDKGVTVDISRVFDSGVAAGFYASFTDVSSDEFGEGSFTKGFYLSIPFDLLTVKPSTGSARIHWSPLTRDGGQRLGRAYSLYGLTDPRAPEL